MMTYIQIAIGVLGALGIAVATWKAPRMTSILFWAAVATILIGSAGVMNVPGAVDSNLVWLSLSFPLVWVLLQFWCYWDASKWRVAGGMIGICVVSGIIVFASSPLG
ncbi:MAG: hypothetical protein AAGH87_08715 [Pseudomonadota bacterium]